MKEIYTLTIKCLEGAYWEGEFSWTVEVPSTMTLTKLHQHIQDHICFDDDHLAAFFIARDAFARKQVWLTNPERGTGWGKTLAKIYPLESGQKLFYLFDFGDNWTFSIGKKAKVKENVPKVNYPLVIKESGQRPEQYPDYDDEDDDDYGED
jgi:hypothetical protein